MEERKNPGGAVTSSILSVAGRANKTPAPGAISSPQEPGQVPDRSTVPGHFSTRVTRAQSVRRPNVQYGTAEEIMKVFRKHGQEITPEQFEQATASFEEMRKADPAALPPVRPARGYVLDQIEAMEQLEAESQAGEF
jgi:hypothetical protein